ncbi:MarR family transcriptional regulator [Nocardia sp. R6R-6]|uniref:MarR family transcriptional regulator n=1 Tax=Nocardia sp. R6R-6 TaxID=3459303 RepID=UPI00403E0892
MNRRNGVANSDPRPAQGRGKAVPALRDSTFVTEDFLPYLLNQTTNVWNHNFTNTIRHSTVNARQWRILAILLRKPGVSLTELVDMTAIDQPTSSRMVDQLNTRGLLKREVAENDARFLCLSLTDEGAAAVEDLWPLAWRQYRRGIGELAPEEEALLITLLKRVLDSLQT